MQNSLESRDHSCLFDVPQNHCGLYTCRTGANGINKTGAQWMRQGVGFTLAIIMKCVYVLMVFVLCNTGQEKSNGITFYLYEDIYHLGLFSQLFRSQCF